MDLNMDKCAMMYFGNNNPGYDFNFNDNGVDFPIRKSKCERDLGVYISDNLKWEQQVEVVASSGNRALGILKNTFVSRDRNLLNKLYKVYVRPLLDFAAPVWNPFLKKDIAKIEKVQRRFTKLHPELKDLPYQDRLKACELQSLYERRKGGDLLQQYRIENGYDLVKFFVT